MIITNPFRDNRLVVRKSKIHRWGLFADEDMKAFSILEEAPYFEIQREQVDNAPDCERYTYWLTDSSMLIGMGYAGLYNHSSSPNAAFEIDHVNELIRHYTLRDIKANEEITIDYGAENATEFTN